MPKSIPMTAARPLASARVLICHVVPLKCANGPGANLGGQADGEETYQFRNPLVHLVLVLGRHLRSRFSPTPEAQRASLSRRAPTRPSKMSSSYHEPSCPGSGLPCKCLVGGVDLLERVLYVDRGDALVAVVFVVLGRAVVEERSETVRGWSVGRLMMEKKVFGGEKTLPGRLYLLI